MSTNTPRASCDAGSRRRCRPDGVCLPVVVIVCEDRLRLRCASYIACGDDSGSDMTGSRKELMDRMGKEREGQQQGSI